MWWKIGIAMLLLLLYVGYLAYELWIAPNVEDDPVKSESDKWHDECVKSRQAKE